ncbi:spore coat U domain-containing protein [Planktomarina temperata]|nr:spore coat U domain-containing protein [Planktomarina temperata]
MTYAMKLAAPLFLATLTTAQVAQAGSATGTMNVSGNVQGSCTVSAVALNFGAITPGSATDAEGSIGAACTTGTTYTITIDGGSSLVDTNRRLAEACLGPLKLCHYLLTKGVTENGTETVFG